MVYCSEVSSSSLLSSSNPLYIMNVLREDVDSVDGYGKKLIVS